MTKCDSRFTCLYSQIFRDATQYFSRQTPNLAAVIPVMDAFDEHLTNYSLDRKILPSIRAAVGLAKKTLNRYYGRTDESNAYRIAMGKWTLIPASESAQSPR